VPGESYNASTDRGDLGELLVLLHGADLPANTIPIQVAYRVWRHQERLHAAFCANDRGSGSPDAGSNSPPRNRRQGPARQAWPRLAARCRDRLSAADASSLADSASLWNRATAASHEATAAAASLPPGASK
jgi:hypothetical protein